MSKSSPYLKLDYGILNKVKLVLGNGFDLACGLNSSYGHFFDSQKELYDGIEKWINKEDNFPISGTAWDLMFFLLSKENAIYKDQSKLDWKDIENVIKIVLVSEDKTIPYSFYNVIYNKKPLNGYGLLVKNFLSDRCNIEDPKKAYEFLYQELKRFEERFSIFLKNQEDDPTYNENARRMLTESGLLKFCTDKKVPGLVSIDTFNYTTPKIFNELPSSVSIRHINGKIGSAIFGIDSEGIKADDPAFIFTKVSRRMINLIEGGREEFKRTFRNIVIYGHSLAEADYSYYFSIFDAFTLKKYDKYGERLVVAFSNFSSDEEKNEEERRKLADALTKMLASYEQYALPDSTRHSFTELLQVSDRVGFSLVDTSILKK